MKYLLLLLSFQLSFSQNVTLNTSFGNNGFVLNDSSLETYMLILPNQKILCGSSIKVNQTGLPVYNMALLEFNQDGALNNGFGNNGLTSSTITDSNLLKSICLQPDGKIIVCGIYTESSSSTVTINHGFIMRYNSNGNIDDTFGNNGIIRLNGNNHDFYSAESVRIDSNAKIIVAGTTQAGETYIIRLNSDSTFDNSFCNNGIKICNTSQFEFTIEDDQLIVFPDNSMMLNGFDYSDANNPNMAVVKYNSDGSYYSTFGNNGILLFDYSSGPIESIYSINTTNDGKFILSSNNYSTGEKYLIKIFNNGSLDNDFGTNGILSSQISSFVILNDNKLLCVSINPNNTSDITHFTRLNENGTLDTNFNNNSGSFDVDPTIYQDRFFNLKLQNDGNLIAAGQVNSTPIRNTILTNILLNDNLSLESTILSKNNIYIYPNPNNGIFNFSSIMIDSYKIYDLCGKQLSCNNIRINEKNNIITNLKSGVYIIEASSFDEKTWIKLVIN